MESQEHIAGAPMAAIDGRTAAYMLRTLVAQPSCSSDCLLILADRLDEAQPHATLAEQPKVATISRLAREVAPIWADQDPQQAAARGSYVPRCGDHVRHRPSGEVWVVSWAEGDNVAWTGWPNGTARLADCDVTYRCTDQEHRAVVARWACVKDDSRSGRVIRLYGAALPVPA